MPVNDIKGFLMAAVLIAVVGGVIGLVVGPALAALTADAFMAAILVFIVGAVIIFVAKYAKLDNMSFVEWIVLLAFIGAVGQLVVSFAPAASSFLLNASDFTLSGLLFTILYALLAEWGLMKAGVRVK